MKSVRSAVYGIELFLDLIEDRWADAVSLADEAQMRELVNRLADLAERIERVR